VPVGKVAGAILTIGRCEHHLRIWINDVGHRTSHSPGRTNDFDPKINTELVLPKRDPNCSVVIHKVSRLAHKPNSRSFAYVKDLRPTEGTKGRNKGNKGVGFLFRGS
jgi:hypothetical protein